MKIRSIYRYLLPAVALTVGCISCKEDTLMSYDNDNDIFFSLKRYDIPSKETGVNFTELEMEYEGAPVSYAWRRFEHVYDSMYFTTFYYPEDVQTGRVYVPVSYMGTPSTNDRKFSYRINETSTAIEGTHFRILDALVPEKNVSGAIVVEVLRDQLPSEGALTIDFSLLPNENFTTNYKETKRSLLDDTKASVIDFRLVISDDLLPPYDWYPGSPYENLFLGKYSKKKYGLFLEKSGADPAIFYPNRLSSVAMDELNIYVSRFRAYLNDEAVAERPVKEDDGSLMTLP